MSDDLAHKTDRYARKQVLTGRRWADRLVRPSYSTLELIAVAALVASWVVATAFYFWVQRHTTFVVDEWDWAPTAGTSSIRGMALPVNGHLVLVPFLLFRATLDLFGFDHRAFTGLELLSLAAASAGIYVFARSRVGPVVALAPAVAPLFLGTAWPMLTEPMIGTLWSCAAATGIWAMNAVERHTRTADAVACVLVALTFASFSFGFGFIAACWLIVLRDRRRWSRIWVVAAPTLAYVAWRLWATSSGALGVKLSNVVWFPAYVVDSIAAEFAAVAGVNLPYGPWTSLHLLGFGTDRFLQAVSIALVELLGVIAVGLWLHRRGRSLWTLAPFLAVPLVFWLSQSLVLAEFRRPIESRYLYGGLFAMLVVAVETCRGLRFSRFATVAVLTLVVVSAALNLPRFREGRASNLTYADETRADLAALELAGRNADPTFTLSAERLTPASPWIFVHTGAYLQAVSRYGSPAIRPVDLPRQSPQARSAADVILARALKVRLTPAALPASRARCTRESVALGGSVPLPRGGAVLASDATEDLSLGRFADDTPVALGPLDGEHAASVLLPTDALNVPWRVGLSPPGPVTVCPLDKPGR